MYKHTDTICKLKHIQLFALLINCAIVMKTKFHFPGIYMQYATENDVTNISGTWPWKNMITMGKVDTSDLMMMITWPIDISLIMVQIIPRNKVNTRFNIPYMTNLLHNVNPNEGTGALTARVLNECAQWLAPTTVSFFGQSLDERHVLNNWMEIAAHSFKKGSHGDPFVLTRKHGFLRMGSYNFNCWSPQHHSKLREHWCCSVGLKQCFWQDKILHMPDEKAIPLWHPRLTRHWISHLMTWKTQCVVNNGKENDNKCEMISGVPHGNFVGLFSSFINDIATGINPSIKFRLVPLTNSYRCAYTYEGMRATGGPPHSSQLGPSHRPLARYVRLRVAYLPGVPGTFPPATNFKRNR